MEPQNPTSWIGALAVVLFTTVAVARCAPEPARTNDPPGATSELVPYEGWWKGRPD